MRAQLVNSCRLLQLFKRPHPQKRLNIRNLFFHNLENLRPAMAPVKGLCNVYATDTRLGLTRETHKIRKIMREITFFCIAQTLYILCDLHLRVAEVKNAVGQIIPCDNKVLAVEQNKVLIPPAYNKYLAWGFSDMSMRIGNYDSEKVAALFS